VNKIFVTGDCHGDVMTRLSNSNFPLNKTMDRTDLVFIAGDFGSIWNNEPDKLENYTLNWLNDRNFTTMIVGGNHENWTRLIDLPKVEKFGVTLGLIRPNVFFVPNGTLLEYAGKKIFCFGGAMSTDWFHRVEGISGWAREVPTYEEMDFGTRNLESVDYEVDIIISHTMPIKSVAVFVMMMGYHHERTKDPTSNYLSFVKEHTKYNKWYCGHFHLNTDFDGVTCLYEHIINVDDEEYDNYGQVLLTPLWD